MAEESPGRIEAEAVEKAALTLRLEGIDLDKLDPETRREVSHLMTDFAELVQTGLARGDLRDLREGLNSAETEMRDSIFRQRRDETS